jgi:cytochrome P450
MTTLIDDGHVDISNHDSFAGGVPHKTFERLRREDPVHWTPEHDGGRGFWSLTRHADILAANGDNQVFSSAQGIRIEDQTREEYLARRTFQETDPPEHRVTRKLLNPAFSKGAVAGYEVMITELAEAIVEEALKLETFDGVAEIAKQLPMLMLGRILGFPREDLDWLVSKGDALIGNTDPDFAQMLVDKEDTSAYRLMPFRSPAAIELYDYADAILKGEKTIDDQGLLRRIIDQNQNEEVMDERGFKNFFCLLVAAGNDTTRYSIAMALYLLAKDPGLLQQLRAGDLWDSAADEFIRYASPTMHFRRTATEDVEMGGKQIKKGDKVILWFVSGNRDEEVFDDPYAVKLDRQAGRHVAFGQGGVHVCLGMWLARMELRVLLKVLADRVERFELLEDPSWTRSNFICGVKKLPLRAYLRAA